MVRVRESGAGCDEGANAEVAGEVRKTAELRPCQAGTPGIFGRLTSCGGSITLEKVGFVTPHGTAVT